MPKARSRLTLRPKNATLPPPETKLTAPHSSKSVLLPRLVRGYQRHWPLAVIGAGSWLGVYLIVTRIHPDQIADLILPGSYVVLVGLVFLASFCTLAFLLLHSRRAALGSLAVSTWLFLALQQFRLPPAILAIGLIWFAILELVFSLLGMSRQPRKSQS